MTTLHYVFSKYYNGQAYSSKDHNTSFFMAVLSVFPSNQSRNITAVFDTHRYRYTVPH